MLFRESRRIWRISRRGPPPDRLRRVVLFRILARRFAAQSVDVVGQVVFPTLALDLHTSYHTPKPLCMFRTEINKVHHFKARDGL